MIKSSKEISGKVNEKDVWAQITKPIDEGFDFVIFMSGSNITTPLRTRFTKHNRDNKDCLRYIVHLELASLLKNYKEF
ncbi:MAG: hypothetical protein ACW99H_09205 [Candidatus Thorarchaeota archaeon]